MNIVFMTGSHPRHHFLARAVARSGLLAGLVIEQREDHVPAPPDGLDPATRTLFVRHFADRELAERRFFAAPSGTDETTGIDRLDVAWSDLNGPKVRDFLAAKQVDLLLSYGVHKLEPQTLAQSRGTCWNIHGGLSPWYRGAITHFWPSYMLEPQMTGMTVHETTEAIDGGGVIHQNAAELVAGDGIHDLACRAVAGLAAELPKLLELWAAGRLSPPVPHKTAGRIWRGEDWRPEHLHVIYDFYGNHIVDRYLAGELGQKAPKLIRQF